MRASWITIGLIAVMGIVAARILLVSGAGPTSGAPDDASPTPQETPPHALAAATPPRSIPAGAASERTPPAAAARASRSALPTSHRLLVAGRVVDDTGRALSASVVADISPDRSPIDALVQETESTESAHSRDKKRPPTDFIHKLRGTASEVRKRELRVRDASTLVVHALGDGHFEIRGRTTAKHLSVIARFPNHEPVHHRCAVGDHGVRIVVPRAGAIAATVLYDPTIRSSYLAVELTRDGSPPVRLVPDGRSPGQRVFRAIRIPVGYYTLDVRLDGDPTPVVRLPRLEIVPGQDSPDARLRMIDTRTLARQMVLQLRRPNGRPLPLAEQMDGEVHVRAPDGEPIEPQPKLRKSRLVIRTRHAYLNIAIDLPAYEPMHFPVFRGNRTIYLRPRVETTPTEDRR